MELQEAFSVSRTVQAVGRAEAVTHVLAAVSDGFLRAVGDADMGADNEAAKAVPLLAMAIANVQQTSMPSDEAFLDACNDLLVLLTIEELRRAGLAAYDAPAELFDKQEDIAAQFFPTPADAAETLSVRARRLWEGAVRQA